MNTKYFKTVCVIMLIFGIMGVLSSFNMFSGDESNLAMALLSLASCLLQIVAGFVGNKAVKTGDTDQAALCRKLSYVILAVAVINLIVSLVVSRGASAAAGAYAGIMTGIILVGNIVSLILPVLYFLGARKLGD